ncbi:MULTISPECIES: hypothetical protein [Streptomyces]|uniref:hypothetical protein n=1 Tax=Streptomyces TaxID=1883 RepID=UPI001F3F9D16|nr:MULTISPECIES: hypothetical protein [Streptomyces]
MFADDLQALRAAAFVVHQDDRGAELHPAPGQLRRIDDLREGEGSFKPGDLGVDDIPRLLVFAIPVALEGLQLLAQALRALGRHQDLLCQLALLRQFPHPDGHFQDQPREGLTVHLRLSDRGKAHAKVEYRDGMAEATLTLTGLPITQLHLVMGTLKETEGETLRR